MTKTIKFDLLQNAIDSIEYAIDLLAYENSLKLSTKYKRVIQAISHGIELLLKERLRRIHPSLVWENVDKYPNLDSRTVNSEGALNRLINIGGLKFHRDDIKLLRSIRKTRNAIEHYTWVIQLQEADFIAGMSLGFVAGFMKEHLDYDMLGYAERDCGAITDLISNNKIFAQSFEMRNSSKTHENINSDIQCQFCKALIQKNDDFVCPICGHWDSKNYFKSDSWLDENPF